MTILQEYKLCFMNSQGAQHTETMCMTEGEACLLVAGGILEKEDPFFMRLYRELPMDEADAVMAALSANTQSEWAWVREISWGASYEAMYLSDDTKHQLRMICKTIDMWELVSIHKVQ